MKVEMGFLKISPLTDTPVGYLPMPLPENASSGVDGSDQTGVIVLAFKEMDFILRLNQGAGHAQ